MRKMALLIALVAAFNAAAMSRPKKDKDKGKDSGKEKTAVKTDAQPAWVDNPAQVYPASAYFQAVGTGADRASAELEAVRGIASIFSQNVTSTSSASKRMEQAVKDGLVVTAANSGISQETVTQVNLDDVLGVEVKGFWQNAKDGTCLAIAVMDKSKACQIYSSIIKQNDSEVRKLMAADESNTKEYFTFETYARFDLARETAKKNEGYLERLAVINPSLAASIRSACVPSKEAAGKALEIAQAIPIEIKADGDVKGKVQAAVAQAVAKSGFRTSCAAARYIITVQLALDKRDTDTTVQCRYSADIQLHDTLRDEVLLPYSISGRESSKDWEGAQYNALRALEKKVQNGFTKSFEAFLEDVAAY